LIAALLAGALISAASADQIFERRMRDSAAAAQALQGPLDGGWTVADAKGRALYLLQIADPPHAAAPLTAAWSDPRTGALGGVDVIIRVGDHLSLAFAPDPAGGAVRLVLTRAKGGVWRGWVISGGVRRPVRLRRS
jgi:hypothetical protein